MTDDLISRQAAIDAINTWDKFGVDERSRIVRWHEGLEPYVHLRDVLTAIVNLPSAEPEQQWIPVTERLPKENGDYLVTGRHGAVNKRKYEDGRWYGNWAVIAWMPLPKPWKGEDNE